MVRVAQGEERLVSLDAFHIPDEAEVEAWVQAATEGDEESIGSASAIVHMALRPAVVGVASFLSARDVPGALRSGEVLWRALTDRLMGGTFDGLCLYYQPDRGPWHPGQHQAEALIVLLWSLLQPHCRRREDGTSGIRRRRGWECDDEPESDGEPESDDEPEVAEA